MASVGTHNDQVSLHFFSGLFYLIGWHAKDNVLVISADPVLCTKFA